MIDAGDTAWLITATALVLFMTLPGLALFYGGLVRAENVLSVLMQCFTIACLMSVLWLIAGYSLTFSGDGPWIGDLKKVLLLGVPRDAASGSIPESVFFMFQMTFAIITPALMVGAFVERPGVPSASGWAAAWLFLALLAGAIVSAISNGQLSFSFDREMWWRNLLGGFLMGAGAMLVPGGNASLILQDLPALSVHAIFAYLAMVAGIAVTLMVFRRLMGMAMTVSCGGDFCSVKKGPPQ